MTAEVTKQILVSIIKWDPATRSITLSSSVHYNIDDMLVFLYRIFLPEFDSLLNPFLILCSVTEKHSIASKYW